jgi:hypothetical protein
MNLLLAATAHAHSARLHTRTAGNLVGLEELVEIVPKRLTEPKRASAQNG